MAESIDIISLLKKLSIEEKISLLSGVDGWQTQDIPGLGIGSLKVLYILLQKPSSYSDF